MRYITKDLFFIVSLYEFAVDTMKQAPITMKSVYIDCQADGSGIIQNHHFLAFAYESLVCTASLGKVVLCLQTVSILQRFITAEQTQAGTVKTAVFINNVNTVRYPGFKLNSQTQLRINPACLFFFCYRRSA